MEVDWNFFLNFPDDTTDDTIIPTNFFAENNENSTLEDIITPPESPKHIFNELEVKEIPIELPSQSPDNFNDTYQYNLCVRDSFDDWMSVDTFIHNYCYN